MESLSLQSITNNKPYQILDIVRISNTLSVVGHIGAGGAIGVSIGVVGIVLLGIVSTTLVVVNTVLAELAAAGTMVDEPTAMVEEEGGTDGGSGTSVVDGGGGGARVEEGGTSVVEGGGTGGCKEIKVYHFTAVLLHKP